MCVRTSFSLFWKSHSLSFSFYFSFGFFNESQGSEREEKRKKDEEIVLLLLLLLSGLFVSIHLLCDVVRFLLVEASKVWPLVGLTLQQEHLIKGRARLTPPPL